MHKKNLPLSVLKVLEPFVGLKNKLFTIEDPEDKLLIAKDIDTNSKFFFSIDKFENANNEESYTLTYSPRSDKDVKEHTVISKAAYVSEIFNNWVDRLESYSKIKSFYDDPILESYEAEFYSNFEFDTEDFDLRPYTTTQILQLDHFLEQVNNRLIEMTDQNNRDSIETIILEIEYVRDNLATRSQKWVAENVSKIFAKIAKQGVKFMKEFWSEGRKEFIKEIVKIAITEGLKRLHQ